jgi:hypothetical protein
MKNLLLIITLFFSNSILIAQNFNQPALYNNVCDDNNDGFAPFQTGTRSNLNFGIDGHFSSA